MDAHDADYAMDKGGRRIWRSEGGEFIEVEEVLGHNPLDILIDIYWQERQTT